MEIHTIAKIVTPYELRNIYKKLDGETAFYDLQVKMKRLPNGKVLRPILLTCAKENAKHFDNLIHSNYESTIR